MLMILASSQLYGIYRVTDTTEPRRAGEIANRDGYILNARFFLFRLSKDVPYSP